MAVISNCVIVRVSKFKQGTPSQVIDQEILTGEDAAMKSVARVKGILAGKVPPSWESGFYRVVILQGYQGKHELVEGDSIARWDIEVEVKASVSVISFEGVSGEQFN